MTDYTDLINELICYAENDQDFIEPQDSINTKAAQAIKTLIAERELDEQRVADLMVQLGDLAAERDAAFAMSRCECESNEACKNLVALHDEVERLKSALHEAKGLLDWYYDQYADSDASKVITTINEALK